MQKTRPAKRDRVWLSALAAFVMGLDPGARKLGFDFSNQIGAEKIIREINTLSKRLVASSFRTAKSSTS
jgi:hypothetical protein